MIIAQLILALACLTVLAIVLGWTWAMGVFAVAPRRARQIQAHRAVTATVIPNRVSQPVQQLAVSFWEPPRIKGELER